MTRQALIRTAAAVSAALALAALCALPGHGDEAHVTGAVGGQQGGTQILAPAQVSDGYVRFRGGKPAAIAVYAQSWATLYWPTYVEVYDARGRLIVASRDSALPLLVFTPKKTATYRVRIINPTPFTLNVTAWTN